MKYKTIKFKNCKISDLIYNRDGYFVVPKILIINESSTQRGNLVCDIVYHLKSIPIGMVITSSSYYYDTFIPKLFIHDEHDIALLKNLMIRQQLVINKNKKRVKKQKKPIDIRSFIIFDDYTNNLNLVKNKYWQELMYHSRHYSIATITTVASSRIIVPPELRSQFEFIFISKNIGNKKKIYESYGGMFSSCQIFKDVLGTLENDEWMVINNKIRSADVTKKSYSYKTSQHEDFKVGNKRYWNFHYWYHPFSEKYSDIQIKTC
jgi:hypothetical protein